MATPKELLRQIAEIQDQMTEAMTKPLKDLAASLGLPTPPEPPRAAELVESLPDIPAPGTEALPLPPLPQPPKTRARIAKGTGMAEVGKMEVPQPQPPSRVRFKII